VKVGGGILNKGEYPLNFSQRYLTKPSFFKGEKDEKYYL